MEFKEYFVVFLRRNPDYISKGEEQDNEYGKNHFAFIQRHIDSRSLYAAGPLSDEAGGLYFFDATNRTKEDILAFLANDDTIRFKMFIPEIYKWSIPEGVLTFTYENLKRLEAKK